MMQSLIGQTLDGKYRIERELGRGGMGAVYLAVHVGTKRPVAVKVIVPQLMKNAEFVERFRREAEAAGRLRHPNVVDVTDFGFAATPDGQAAYLVMEYLDGCTLSEILQEEKKLSLRWTVDIIEQVCAGLQEAHRQGIIHRDLKPDNIWLEPNQRGGFTAKVLDFGIAKLEPPKGGFLKNFEAPREPVEVTEAFPNTGDKNAQTLARQENGTSQTDGETGYNSSASPIPMPRVLSDVRLNQSSEKSSIYKTSADIKLRPELIPPPGAPPVETYNQARPTAEITRVGAILGTPLYMSPEQCRGERLGTSSDIYSLGVIAYQMLSGKTPFEGEYLTIMAGHLQLKPPPLAIGKTPRKVKKVIFQALSKEPIERPLTAEIFASQLRSYSEGIVKIYQRSLVVFFENFFRIIGFSLIFYFPTIVLGIITFVFDVLELNGAINPSVAAIIQSLVKHLNLAVTMIGEILVQATVMWIIIQYIDAPLRSIRLTRALKAVFEKWRQFAWILPVRIFLNLLIQGDFPGFPVGVILVLSYVETLAFWALTGVIMMENFRGLEALKRSWRLTLKAVPTVLAAFFLNSVILFVIGISINVVFYGILALIVQKVYPQVFETSLEEFTKFVTGISLISLKLAGTLILPFFAVVSALLYLKTRNAGGESMRALLDKFKESDFQQTNWQKRIHYRLGQSRSKFH